MKQFLLGLSLSVAFILGCVASKVVDPVTSVRADSHVESDRQDWAYHCIRSHTLPDLKVKANEVGQRGWEMVGMGTGFRSEGSTRDLFAACFKRPRN